MSYSGQENNHSRAMDDLGEFGSATVMSNSFVNALRFWMERTGKTQAEVAELANVSQAYVSMLVGGKKKPSSPTIDKISEAFGVDVGEFFSLPAYNPEAYFLVPKVKARPMCGSGGLETDGDFGGWYSFKTDFLRRRGVPNAMRLFEVVGDSMQPTLVKGDMVLVDTSQKDLSTGQLALVRVDDDLMVKRIEKRPGVIVFKSDNSENYEPIRINQAGADNVEIYGRMIWSCREY